jgi:predicted O-methyltransferase YrrM
MRQPGDPRRGATTIDSLNEQRRRYAADLVKRSREHDRGKEDRLERYRNLEPETAELLSVLVRACAPQRVLEIGTSNGYSTIWIADACEEFGATLVSVDNEPSRTGEARTHLAALNLGGELRIEDAAQTLSQSSDASWDLVFLDAERPAYAGYWPELLRVVRPGGLIAIDNVLSHAGEVEEITNLVLATPGVSTTVIPTGAGLRLVVR